MIRLISHPARVSSSARGVAEDALEHAGWPWSRPLSLWIDVLVAIEEQAQEPAE